MKIEFLKCKRTDKAYRLIVKELNVSLAIKPARIFQKLYENIGKPVPYIDLLNFIYDENETDPDYYKLRVLDTNLSTKIKPLANKLGYDLKRQRGQSLTLIPLV
ncbi:Uncharacterised protein [Algoriella xinjiangensis]|uniref:hypothetical protein n=1 Tax=Algoriella xinjiangensis TaxID=684065 RepID=UPI000F640068|nr:hypothetical protein [Algoriella xinjiangensis]VDH16882.1 Uncharacterised protein [Algoriella xinjiangensis]